MRRKTQDHIDAGNSAQQAVYDAADERMCFCGHEKNWHLPTYDIDQHQTRYYCNHPDHQRFLEQGEPLTNLLPWCDDFEEKKS